MNNSQHTPGPWDLRPDPYCKPLQQVIRFRGQEWDLIASLHAAFVGTLEANANAHLIAAAPDLKSALEALIHICRPTREDGSAYCIVCRGRTDPEDAGNGKWVHRPSCPVAEAEQVLAKARGVTQ